MQQSTTRTAPPSVGLTALLVTFANTAAACSASPATITTSPVVGSGGTTSNPVVGSGGTASSPGSASGSGGAPRSEGAPSSTTSTSVTNGHPNKASGAGPSASGTSAGGQGDGPVTTIDGLPPPSQQFKADDAAFETALDTAQSSVSHLHPNSTAQQVTQAVQPLMTAADLFQSQIANLQWSATGKPRAQFLSEDVGQLVAEIVAIERPGGFLSVGQVVAQLSTVANTLRATSDSVDAQLGS